MDMFSRFEPQIHFFCSSEYMPVYFFFFVIYFCNFFICCIILNIFFNKAIDRFVDILLHLLPSFHLHIFAVFFFLTVQLIDLLISYSKLRSKVFLFTKIKTFGIKKTRCWRTMIWIDYLFWFSTFFVLIFVMLFILVCQ
jgi:hypothetical protein